MAIEMQVDEVPCEIWLDPIKIDSLLRLAENAPLKLLFQAGIADKPGPGALRISHQPEADVIPGPVDRNVGNDTYYQRKLRYWMSDVYHPSRQSIVGFRAHLRAVEHQCRMLSQKTCTATR